MPIRKDSCDLTDREWERLICAMQEVKEDTSGDGWNEWENFHQTYGEHGATNNLYLAWHRGYLHQFEIRLQEVDNRVALPYWNWTERGRIPKELRRRSWMGITRRIIKIATRHKKATDRILGATNFADMNVQSWDIHARIHGWTGGDMKSASSSANDPLFFLHHAQIDRLWMLWQEEHANIGYELPNINMNNDLSGFIGLTANDVIRSENIDVTYA